jgi:hypothetical protein
MPSRLTDGLPITTEWLNSLVDAIQDLTPSTEAAVIRPVIYTGSVLGPSASLQIEAGQHTGVATGGTDEYESTITFNTPFKDNNVVVVVTPTFVSQGTRRNRPFKASASVGLITNSKFECTISLVSDTMEFNVGKQVMFNYLAIGKRA